MAQWTAADPGAGSLGQIDGSITNASSMATDIDNVLHTTTATKNSVGSDLWSGSASVAWHASAIGAMSNLPSMRNTLTASISAMQTYREAVSAIDDSATSWKQVLATTTAIMNSGTPFRWLWEVEEQKADELKAERNAEKFREAIEKLSALGMDREAADAVLVAALTEAMPSDWPQQHAAFVSAGMTDADMITVDGALAAMEELAQNLVDGDSGGNADADAISALLDLYGNDEATMSEFYQSFGGANTVALIDRIGTDAGKNMREEENLLLAKRIRESLSTGSESWDAETADAFAYDMFHGGEDYYESASAADPLDYQYGRPEAIAFLFSDPDGDPMGANFSLAASIEMDQRERELGRDPWKGFAESSIPRGSALWLLEHPDATPPYAIDDTASMIFQNLANHPDHAMEFLDGADGSGEERRAFWFGERDWSGADGFEAPGELWVALQSIDGGPFDPEPTGAATRRIADLSSQIMFELVGNEHFVPESFSEGGGAAMANAIAPHLAAMADYMYRHGAESGDETGGVWDNAIFGGVNEVPLPIVTEALIAELLGTIGSTDKGGQYIHDNMTQLQDFYMTEPFPPGATLDDSIKRATIIQGAIDGAGIGTQLAEAQRADDATDKGIDEVMSAVNLIPIPGASKLFVEGGIKIVDKVQGIVIKELKSEGVGAWKEHLHVYDDLDKKLDGVIVNQSQIHQVKTTVLVYDSYADQLAGQVEAPPVVGTGETDESFLARSLDWSTQNADRIAAITGTDPLSLQVDYSYAHKTYNTNAEDGA